MVQCTQAHDMAGVRTLPTLATALIAAMAPFMADAAAAEPVDVELVLAVDGSLMVAPQSMPSSAGIGYAARSCLRSVRSCWGERA